MGKDTDRVNADGVPEIEINKPFGLYYLVQQILEEIPPAKEISVKSWFRQTHGWVLQHNECRQVFTAPETQRGEPFYGVSRILNTGRSRIELLQHTRESDYGEDYDFLSLVTEKGLFPNGEREQFVVLENQGEFRWYWRVGFDYKWKHLSQNKVPLYAIFSITESVVKD